MTWSNIKIPDYGSQVQTYRDNIARCELERKILSDKLMNLEHELDNIFNAAKKFKEIQITDRYGKETITLVLKK